MKFLFRVKCTNNEQTKFVLKDKYEQLLDCFINYLNDVENYPYIVFKANSSNPYASHDAEGFEKYLYNQNGLFIEFEVENGKIINWGWSDNAHKYIEYDKYIELLNNEIQNKVYLTEEIIDKYTTANIQYISNNEEEYKYLYNLGDFLLIGKVGYGNYTIVKKSEIVCIYEEENHPVFELSNKKQLRFEWLDYDDFEEEFMELIESETYNKR